MTGIRVIARGAPGVASIVGALCILGACSGGAGGRSGSDARGPATSETSLAASHTGAALDRDFPDPTVIRASDGAYYAYATQSVSSTGAVNIQVARSEDLERWAYLGDALPDKPAWASTTQSFWAPHVVEHDGTFFLYYSAVPDDADSDETCLAVATSPRPGGPFEDGGGPILCGYEIDPAVFHDPRSNGWFMYWGSAGNIVVQQLGKDLTDVVGASPKTLLLGWSSPVRRPYEHGIEGPFVIHRRGWYYLFYSGDRCCEFPPHYAVLVARSRRPDGGFERLGSARRTKSSVILSGWGQWTGTGHCSVVRDGSGQDWIAYHAIDRRHPYLASGDVRRPFLLDRLGYRDGWPVVLGRSKPKGA